LVDAPHQTEGVSRGVPKHLEQVFADGPVDPGRPELEHLSFGFIDVVDENVEVELLGPARVRESRWFVVG
jgi:hypothetical protein